MTQLRNVAVVGFAQAPIVAHDPHRMANEMLYPVVREALRLRHATRQRRLVGRDDPRIARQHGQPLAMRGKD